MSLIEQPKPQPDQRSTVPVTAPSVDIPQARPDDRLIHSVDGTANQ